MIRAQAPNYLQPAGYGFFPCLYSGTKKSTLAGAVWVNGNQSLADLLEAFQGVSDQGDQF